MTEIEFFKRHPSLYVFGGTFLLVFFMGMIAFLLAYAVTGG